MGRVFTSRGFPHSFLNNPAQKNPLSFLGLRISLPYSPWRRKKELRCVITGIKLKSYCLNKLNNSVLRSPAFAYQVKLQTMSNKTTLSIR
jgi:hypothetical protein